MSKGQIIGQVFIYITAVVVIGVIALMGYNAITSMVNKSCSVEQVTFKSEIENLIEKYSGYGSVTKKSISAPCGYEEVCFVSAKATGSIFCPENKLIEGSWSPSIKQNIYAISKKSTIAVGYAKLLSVENITKCTCIKSVNGRFDLTLKGEGSATVVSRT